ncbi:unnamed protein product [Trichogramma brassicae]|uniref:Endonuclease/exonuclease/phosphatase domain-containing protein n=1 Tax=Trichogramma brassicae TaxID=86971 RepID=A0A6H5IHN2_9HYME|nr:unnamed protein product [Trichogramma brassicae]
MSRESSYNMENWIYSSFASQVPCVWIDIDVDGVPVLLQKSNSLFLYIEVEDNVNKHFTKNLKSLTLNFPAPIRVLLIMFNRNDDFSTRYLEQFWVEQLVDVTIIRISIFENRRKIGIIHRETDYAATVHHYNPFTEAYTNEALDSSIRLFPAKLDDLHGYRLRVGFVENLPYTLGSQKSKEHMGIYDSLLDLIQSKLNFSVEPKIPMEYPPMNDSYTGLLLEIVSKLRLDVFATGGLVMMGASVPAGVVTFRERILFGCILVVGLFYSSTILAHLTSMNLDMDAYVRFENYRDLDESGLIPFVPPYLFNLTFVHGTDPALRRLGKKAYQNEDGRTCFIWLLDHANVSCIFGQKLNSILLKLHSDRMKEAEPCFWSAYRTFIMPQGSPYTSSFNRIIRVAQESGIFQKWWQWFQNDAVRKHNKKFNVNAVETSAVLLRDKSNDRGLRSSDDLGYMRGGGVAFYLHNSLNFAVLESPSVPDLDEAEFMMLDVSTAAESVCQHVLVVVLYRQPDGPAGLALTLFFSVLDNYRHSFKNIIIMGDFNVDMNRCDNFSRHLSTLIHERGLYLVPSPNTHFTYRPSSTLIDLTIIDESSKLLRYSVGDVPIAGGHCVTVLGYRLPLAPG